MSKPMGIGEIPQNARVWIYGTGAAGKGLLFQLRVSRPDVRPLGFLDSFRSGRVLGLRVRNLEGFLREGLDREGAMILVASAASEAIAENLDSHGVSNYRRSVVPPPIMSRLGEAKLWKSLARIFLRRIFSLFSLLPGGLRPFTLFTGGYGGLFAGNSKALFLEFLRRGERAVWLYSERSVGEELKREGVRAVRYGSLLGFLLLPLCRLLVVDNRDWPWNYPLLPLFPLRRVQLWHGVGMKKIEKMLLPAGLKERLSLPCREEWNLRYPHYDLLVTTSPFYAREVFAPAFAEEAEEILTTGYPLNDLFHREPYPEEWLFTDQEVVGPVKEHLRRGGQVAVYAPTFRDLERRLALERILDPLRLDRFLQERGILLVLKGHSFSLVEKASSRRFSHILTADNGRDIYPILRLSQLLITDYSSILSDYLHTGRPILFFPFDLLLYQGVQRELQFDYGSMAPGPKAYNQEELEGWIHRLLVQGEDPFREERERLYEKAFLYRDGGSGERLMGELFRRGFLKGGKSG